MSIHMTRVETSEGCRLRIDGRLEEGSLAEFAQACESVDGKLTLDLSGVSWIDDRALDLLKRLAASGAVVENPSPYVELLLKD